MRFFTFLLSFLSIGVVIAQDELEIDVNRVNSFRNTITLSGSMLDYGRCYGENVLHLVLFDSLSCTVLKTNSATASTKRFGSCNEFETCNARNQYYFAYQMNVNQLNYLDSIVETSIQSKRTFAIYTPNGFSIDSLIAHHPELYTHLMSYFPLALGQSSPFAVGYNGEQFFEVSMPENDDEVKLRFPVCSSFSASLNNLMPSTKIQVLRTDNEIHLTSSTLPIESIQLYTIDGKCLFSASQVANKTCTFTLSRFNENNLYIIHVKTSLDEEVIKMK